MKFKYSMLAASMAVALSITGCGSSDSDSSGEVVASGGMIITAIDGYLEKANISVGDNCEIPLGVTNHKGQFTIPDVHKGKKVCVEAVAGTTIDSFRGIVDAQFTLAAPAGYDVVSPMTNMVVDQMIADKGLTQKDAEQKVVAQFDSLKATEDQLFGDYIADATAGDDTAKAINVVGEVLVDNHKASVDRQLELTNKVAQAAHEIIKDENQILDNYSPVVTIPPEPEEPIVVAKNQRPKATETAPIKQEIKLEGSISDINISEYFMDADGDVLAYSFDVEGADKETLGLSINPQGIVSGTPKLAGVFTLYFYATDGHDARSYPITTMLTVIAPNTAPTVNNAIQKALQVDFADWTPERGLSLEKAFSMDGLFTDADKDVLTLTAKTDAPGVNLSIDGNNTLWVKGVPIEQGTHTITVTASDGINSDVATANFTLIITKGPVVENPYPLENKTWYMLEHGTGDGDGDISNDYSRVWCETVRFENGIVYGNERSLDNRTSCAEAAETEYGTYTDSGDNLNVTLSEGKTGVVSFVSTADKISAGAYTVKSWGERYTYFVNKTDAEKRIKLQSNAEEGESDFAFYLPATQTGYNLGSVSVQLNETSQFALEQGDEGVMSANVTFDNASGKSITCEEINEFYSTFYISGEDLRVTSQPRMDVVDGLDVPLYDFECYEKNENGVTYAAVDFDINQQLSDGKIYSIIAKPRADEKANFKAHIESVKFNIQWVANN